MLLRQSCFSLIYCHCTFYLSKEFLVLSCCTEDDQISGNDMRITAVPSPSDCRADGDCSDWDISLEVPETGRRRSGRTQSASSLITCRVATNATHSRAPCSELTTMKMYHKADQSVNAATKPSTQPRPITTDNFT